ncbi:MAG: hypothetical protein MZU91_10745 [Desulfosudis oleivorans]|nr:hypothetical protein [Desulfosudis oleivorans]
MTVAAAPVASFSYSPASPDRRDKSVTVHGHLDGDADLVVVELRGRQRPATDPATPATRSRRPGSKTVSLAATNAAGSNSTTPDGDGDGGAGGVVQLQPRVSDGGTGRDSSRTPRRGRRPRGRGASGTAGPTSTRNPSHAFASAGSYDGEPRPRPTARGPTVRPGRSR